MTALPPNVVPFPSLRKKSLTCRSHHAMKMQQVLWTNRFTPDQDSTQLFRFSPACPPASINSCANSKSGSFLNAKKTTVLAVSPLCHQGTQCSEETFCGKQQQQQVSVGYGDSLSGKASIGKLAQQGTHDDWTSSGINHSCGKQLTLLPLWTTRRHRGKGRPRDICQNASNASPSYV